MTRILESLRKQSFQITGKSLTLRLASVEDASEDYLSWLNDPEVNMFLETRFEIQNLERINSRPLQQSHSSLDLCAHPRVLGKM